MYFKFFILIMIMMLGQGCTINSPGAKENVPNETPRFVEAYKINPNILLTQLDIPWAITKIENTFYISQRKGSIVKYNNSTGKVTLQHLYLKKKLYLNGEGGFLGLALTPNFAITKEAYAYYTYQTGKQIFNRLVVIQLEKNQWREKRVLLDHILGAIYHDGGRIKIGPGQKLYVTIGDALKPANAQNLTSLNGKILRLNLDGSIPSDNPFPQSYVYSYGHRNPQGIAWDENGNMYETEHGQHAHDEINVIHAGKNYGWPVIQGDEKAPNMVTPLFQSGNQTWAPSGLGYYHQKLYVAMLRGSQIREFDITSKISKTIFDLNGRMRDTFIENDKLFFISNNRDGRGTPDKSDDRLYELELSN